MIKTLLIIAILSICVCIGCIINNYFLMRVNVYKSLTDIINSIKTEIAFLKTDKLMLLSNQQYKNKHVKEFIDGYVSTGYGEIYCLKPSENKELIDLFDSIGRSDIDGELNNLQYYENIISKNYQYSQEKFNKYGAFSIKMSIIIGTLIAIILI